MRLFSVLDENKDNYLSLKEFTIGLIILFCEEFEKLADFIFKLYDTDSDNFISREEVKSILNFIPLALNKKDLTSSGKNKKKQYEKFLY